MQLSRLSEGTRYGRASCITQLSVFPLAGYYGLFHSLNPHQSAAKQGGGTVAVVSSCASVLSVPGVWGSGENETKIKIKIKGVSATKFSWEWCWRGMAHAPALGITHPSTMAPGVHP